MMKKLLVFLSVLMLSVTMNFAQPFNITFAVDDIDISALNPGDEVVVPLMIESTVPWGVVGSLTMGFDLFLNFDHAVLTWKGTSANPLAGAQNFHPQCPYAAADWTFNDNGTSLVALWGDPTWAGQAFPDGAVLFEALFTYNGGVAPGDSSPLEWSTSKKVAGGKQVKGATFAFTDQFVPYDNILLNNGSVCNDCGSGPIDFVWTGATNSNFTEATNWNPNGVPGDNDVDDTATIPAGTPLCASSAADHTFAALTVEAGGTIALSAKSFHITGDMTVEAGGFFYMGLDPATNMPGSLVVDGNILGGGLFTYGYYIPNMDAEWHAVSSPMLVKTYSPDLFNGWDGFMNDLFLNYWDEPNNTYVHVDNGDSCTLSHFDFVPGVGGFVLLDNTWATDPCNVAMGGPNTGTIDYSGGLPQFIEFSGLAGTVNNADIAYPMTFTAGGSFAGWNLVGNPFPGTFDITATTWDAGVDQSVYAFDGTNYVSGTAAGVGNTLMPAGQGFFVHTANGANFNFDKAAVVMSTNAALKSETNILKLRATDGQYEDVTYINLDKEATESFDTQRDAYKKFTPVEAVPQIYTQSVEGTNLSINSFDILGETMNLFFRAGVNGSFTIDAVETGNYSTVILEDTFNGSLTNLLTDSYTFDYSTTDTDARFVLHFAPLLGVNENASHGIEIFSFENTITVNIDNDNASEIVIYDLLGQEVLRQTAHNENTFTMSEDNYYLVSVILSDNVVTTKVFVK